MSLDIVILAAGQGTRMHSSVPKVLHTLAGVPLLRRVLNTAQQLHSDQLILVISPHTQMITDVIEDPEIQFVTQKKPEGTGHAVLQALPILSSETVLILYGDVPLIRASTCQLLIDALENHALALLTVFKDQPHGYGRIVRDANHQITAIVEQRDADEKIAQINECNSGIMAIKREHLARWLPRLKAQNAQQEYYLTDIVAFAVSESLSVASVNVEHTWEVEGVNDQVQMAALTQKLQRNQAKTLLEQGVCLEDPEHFILRGSLKAGRDVRIDTGCVFEGEVILDDEVTIEAYCILRDCRIAKGSRIKAFSSIEDSVIGENVTIGPYARLRPQSEIAAHAKIGNFVEVKKSVIGEGAKVNHLSYIGDTAIGEQTNVGAGTITCNYDGQQKHKTQIGARVFIGSNTALVAPIEIGDDALIAAGSTLTQSVGAGELAIARARQLNKSKRGLKTDQNTE